MTQRHIVARSQTRRGAGLHAGIGRHGQGAGTGQQVHRVADRTHQDAGAHFQRGTRQCAQGARGAGQTRIEFDRTAGLQQHMTLYRQFGGQTQAVAGAGAQVKHQHARRLHRAHCGQGRRRAHTGA